MDLDHVLAQLQAASAQWQTAYATSPALRLHQQVAALQRAVQQLQNQRDRQPEGQPFAHTPASAVPANAASQATLLGKMLDVGPPPPAAGLAQANVIDRKTYRQRYITCGKAGCTTCAEGPGHGPYWYAYWREGTKIRSMYIGKQRTPL